MKNNTSNFPEPDIKSRARSTRLSEIIKEYLKENDGWITFSDFMEMALYFPKFGYYTGPKTKFGEKGDFVTSASFGALFGATLSKQISQVLAETKGQIVEIGSGSGRMAADIVLELEKTNSLPKEYIIVERSPNLRLLQKSVLSASLPNLFHLFHWVNEVPMEVDGLIFANELLDALPVNIIQNDGANIYELGVIFENGAFAWKSMPARGDLYRVARQLELEGSYRTEVGLNREKFVSDLGERLAHGVILFIDYGFVKQEFYHPQRSSGTLMCHYKHMAHTDPFLYPGLQDITSHVDFSAIAEAGEKNGLQVLGYTNQAQFLINCDILDYFSRISIEDVVEHTRRANELNKLTSPAEMGELFKVLALGRGIQISLQGFLSRNKMDTL